MCVKSTCHTPVRMKVLTELSFAGSFTYNHAKKLKASNWMNVHEEGTKSEPVLLIPIAVEGMAVDVVTGELGAYHDTENDKVFFVFYKQNSKPHAIEIRQGVVHYRSRMDGILKNIQEKPKIVNAGKNTEMDWEFYGKQYVVFVVSKSGNMWIYWSNKEASTRVTKVVVEQPKKQPAKDVKDGQNSYARAAKTGQNKETLPFQIEDQIGKIKSMYRTINPSWAKKNYFTSPNMNSGDEGRKIFEWIYNRAKSFDRALRDHGSRVKDATLLKAMRDQAVQLKGDLIYWIIIGSLDTIKFMAQYYKVQDYFTVEETISSPAKMFLTSRNLDEDSWRKIENVFKVILRKYYTIVSNHQPMGKAVESTSTQIAEERLVENYGNKLQILLKSFFLICNKLFSNTVLAEGLRIDARFDNAKLNMDSVRIFTDIFIHENRAAKEAIKSSKQTGPDSSQRNEQQDNRRGDEAGTGREDAKGESRKTEHKLLKNKKMQQQLWTKIYLQEERSEFVSIQQSNKSIVGFIEVAALFEKSQEDSNNTKVSIIEAGELLWQHYEYRVNKLLKTYLNVNPNAKRFEKAYNNINQKFGDNHKGYRETVSKYFENNNVTMALTAVAILWKYQYDFHARYKAMKRYCTERVLNQVYQLRTTYLEDIRKRYLKEESEDPIKEILKIYLQRADDKINTFNSIDDYLQKQIETRQEKSVWNVRLESLRMSLESLKEQMETAVNANKTQASAESSFRIPSYGPVYSAIWGAPMIHF